MNGTEQLHIAEDVAVFYCGERCVLLRAGDLLYWAGRVARTIYYTCAEAHAEAGKRPYFDTDSGARLWLRFIYSPRLKWTG